jgi:hypothetical protein
VLARVRRDAAWPSLLAEELVPGDVVHLRQGTSVPADVKQEDGSLLLREHSPSPRIKTEPSGIIVSVTRGTSG